MSSNNVDNRVVNMTFNNEQFEAGISQTLKSLESLKESLKFNTSLTGINAVSNALNGMSLRNISGNVQALTDKFSMLGLVGMTAIQNITNKAINFTTSKFTGLFNTIIGGGWNRAAASAKARFTLEGIFQGDQSRVAKAFESAKNAVTDTAYTLDQAVTAASQLVAAGVDEGDQLEKTLTAISGVAGTFNADFSMIADVFGDASAAMRLTGDAASRLQMQGLNVYKYVGDYMGKTAEEVKEMAGKGQISFQQFSDAMYEAFGEHAKDANKTFSGVTANIKANLTKIGELFSSGIVENKELITFLDDFRKAIGSVKNAITDAKLPESFKNMVTAVSKLGRKLLTFADVTGLSNFFNMVREGMDSITEFINGYSGIEDVVKDSPIGKAAEEVEKVADAITMVTQAEADAAWAIWNTGKYGNGDERKEALKEAGLEYDNVQAYVNALKKANFDLDKVEIQVGETAKESMNTTAEAAKEAGDTVTTTTEKFDALGGIMSAVALFGVGIKMIFSGIKTTVSKLTNTFKKAFSWRTLIEDIKTYAELFNKFVGYFEINADRAEKLEKAFNGLWSILDLVRKAIKLIVTVGINLLGPSLSAIFDIVLNLASAIGSVVNWFDEWTDGNVSLIDTTKKFGETLGKTISTIAKFFASLLNTPVVQKLKNAILELGTTVIDTVGPYFEKAAGFVEGFFDKFNEGANDPAVVTSINTVSGTIETLMGYVGDAYDKIKEVYDFIVEKLKIFGFVKKEISDVSDAVSETGDAISSVQKLTIGQKLGIPILDTLIEYAKKLGGGLLDRLKKIQAWQVVLTGFGASLIILTLNLSSFVSAIKKSFSSFGKIGDSISKVFDNISSIFTQIKKNMAMNTTLTMITKVTLLIVALAAAVIAFALIDTKKLLIGAGVMLTFLGFIAAVAAALVKITQKQEWSDLLKMKDIVDPLNKMFLSLSASVLILALALVKLSELNMDGIALKLLTFVGVMGLVAAMAIVVSKATPVIASGGLSLVGYAAAIYILVRALIKLNDVDIEKIGDKLLLLAGIVGMISVLAVVISRTGSFKIGSGLGLLATVGALILLEVALNYIAKEGVDFQTVKDNLGKFLVVLFTLGAILMTMNLLGKGTGKTLGKVILLLALSYALQSVVNSLSRLSEAIRAGGVGKAIGAMTVVFIGLITLMITISLLPTGVAVKASAILLSIAGCISGLMIIAGLIGMIPVPQLLRGLGAMLGVFAMLGSFIVLISKLATNPIQVGPIIALTAAIATLGITLAILTAVTQKHPEALLTSALSIAGGLIAIGAAYALASKYADNIQLGPLLALIGSVVVIGGALIGLTWIQAKGGSILNAAMAIGAVLLAITAAFVVIAKTDSKITAKEIGGLSVIVSSLITTAAAISALNKVQNEGGSLLKSVLSLMAIITTLVVGLKILNNVHITWSSVAGLTVMVLALLAVASTMSDLLSGEYSWSSMIVAAISMSIVIATMVGMLALLSSISGSSPLALLGVLVAAAALTVTLIAFSIAMKAFSSSIKILIECVKALTKIDYKAIDVEMLAKLCGIVALLGICAGIAAGGVISLGIGFAILARSIMTIAAAVAIIVPNIVLLMNTFKAIGLVGEEVAAGLTALGPALSDFFKKTGVGLVEGITAFLITLASKQPMIIASLSVILTAVLALIMSFATQISVVILNGLISLLSVLEDKLPVINEKVGGLLEGILKFIASQSLMFGYYGADIAGKFVVGIIMGLSDCLSPLLKAGALFVVKFINGIGDAVYEYADDIVASMMYLSSVMYNSLLKALSMTIPGIAPFLKDELEKSNAAIEEYQNNRYDEIAKSSVKSMDNGIRNGEKELNRAALDTTESALDTSDAAKDAAEENADSFVDTLGGTLSEGASGVTQEFEKIIGDIGGYDASSDGYGFFKSFTKGSEDAAAESIVNLSGYPSDVAAKMKEKYEAEGYVFEGEGGFIGKKVEEGLNDYDVDFGMFNSNVADSLGDEDELKAQGNEDKDFYIDGLTNLTDDDIRRLRELGARLGYTIHTGTTSEDGLDENSPSKKGVEASEFYVKGLIIGAEGLSNSLIKAYSGLAGDAASAVGNIMASIATTMNNDEIDWQPTIAPVLDDSQIASVNSILGNRSVFNMAADASLSVNSASQASLAQQVSDLSAQVKRLADTDYSHMMDGVSFNINADTNVDGTPLKKMSASYTVRQLTDEQIKYTMAAGGRA